MDLPKPKVDLVSISFASGEAPVGAYEWALRDLKRKRAEIDAAIAAILQLRPDLRAFPHSAGSPTRPEMPVRSTE